MVHSLGGYGMRIISLFFFFMVGVVALSQVIVFGHVAGESLNRFANEVLIMVHLLGGSTVWGGLFVKLGLLFFGVLFWRTGRR